MNDNIIIDGFGFHSASYDKLAARFSFDGEQGGWRKSVYDFLSDWYSGSGHITVHTSGSTGEPKQIRLPKQVMANSAMATNRLFGLREGDSVLLPLSADYIAGKMMIVRAIVAGLNLTIVRPSSCHDDYPNAEYRFCPMVPMQVSSIINGGNGDFFENIGICIIGGGAVSDELTESLKHSRCAFFSTYGMTETASHVAVMPLNIMAADLIGGREGSFTALPSVSFSLDNRGCLVIDAPKLSELPLVTNDIVRLDSPTSFNWLGRYDNVINSGGIKIHPEELEREIESYIAGRRFYLIGEPDPMLGQKLILVMEGERLSSGQCDELLVRLKGGLKPFHCPREVRFIDNFEQTATGKVVRKLIR